MSRGHRLFILKIVSGAMFMAFMATPVHALSVSLSAPSLGASIDFTNAELVANTGGFTGLIGGINGVSFSGNLSLTNPAPNTVGLLLTKFLVTNFSGTSIDGSVTFSQGINPFPFNPMSFVALLDGTLSDSTSFILNHGSSATDLDSISYTPFYTPGLDPASQVNLPGISPSFSSSNPFSSEIAFTGTSALTTPGILTSDLLIGGVLSFHLGAFDSFNLPNSASISASPAPVPEPGTFLLLGSGLVGMLAFRKKFREDV